MSSQEKPGKTLYDLIHSIIFNRKRFLISLPFLVIGLFIYIYYIKGLPAHVSDLPTCSKWTLSGRLISNNGEYINKKGLTIGIRNGPFDKDEHIINGAFRITNISIPKDGYIVLYLEYNNRSENFYSQPLDSTAVKFDNNTCVITFLQDLTVSEALLGKLFSQSAHLSNIFIEGSGFSSLESRLSRDGYVISRVNPTFRIRFGYSNNIDRLDNSDLFRYNGGKLRLLINGSDCDCLPAFSIQNSAEIGNPLNAVNDSINGQIYRIVANNINVIEQCIKKCLK